MKLIKLVLNSEGRGIVGLFCLHNKHHITSTLPTYKSLSSFPQFFPTISDSLVRNNIHSFEDHTKENKEEQDRSRWVELRVAIRRTWRRDRGHLKRMLHLRPILKRMALEATGLPFLRKLVHKQICLLNLFLIMALINVQLASVILIT